MKKLIFLLFICLQTGAQTISFKGKLLDKETNKPVVYANISFLKMNAGISSLEDGTFNLEIDKKLLQEKIHISCLNYKDTIVLADNLQQKTLFLQPKSFELNEVVISKKVDRELEVNKIKARKVKTSMIGTADFPWTVARYFEFKKEYEKTPYLKNVIIFLSTRENRKAKFKVRVFSKDSITGFPKDDLIIENLIVDVSQKEKKVVLDLSKYDLEIPKKGVFISLERLNIPYNIYDYVFKYKDSISKKVKRVAPDFGAIPVYNEKRYMFKKGKWYSSENDIIYYKDKTLVPAISLTLSI
jgi:hypothetical protein